MPSKKTLSSPENFLLSGIAALISKTVAAPIERIKLLIQSQNELLKSKRLSYPYKSPIDCFTRTITNEGILALWRGNLANCLRYFPTQSLNFMFKEKLQSKLKKYHNSNGSLSSELLFNTLSGSCAGLFSLTILYSLYYSRVRLANDAFFLNDLSIARRQFSGITDVYKQTYSTDGIIGLYRGYCITCWSVIIYRGIYFGMYDTLKPLLIANKFESNQSNHIFASFLLAFTVTSSAGMIIYPFDTIATRMLMRSGEGTKYKGSIDCFRYIRRTEGLKSFYKGCFVNIFRNLSGAGTLVGFDVMKNFYIKHHK
eukprot:58320_1